MAAVKGIKEVNPDSVVFDDDTVMKVRDGSNLLELYHSAVYDILTTKKGDPKNPIQTVPVHIRFTGKHPGHCGLSFLEDEEYVPFLYDHKYKRIVEAESGYMQYMKTIKCPSMSW